MEILENDVLEMIGGGDAEQNAAAVNANANTAVRVCGAGNVASVSTTGFSCKP